MHVRLSKLTIARASYVAHIAAFRPAMDPMAQAEVASLSAHPDETMLSLIPRIELGFGLRRKVKNGCRIPTKGLDFDVGLSLQHCEAFRRCSLRVTLHGAGTFAYSGTMAQLWSLKGLSWRELAKRTCRKSWDDEVFGQAARLAFYYFLSLFPVLLLLLIVFDKLAGTGSNLRDTLLGAFQQILPRQASALIAKTVAELNAGAVIGVGAVAAGLGSAWGA